MIRAGLDRDADEGTRQVDAAVRNNDSVRGEIVEPLAGQDDDVSGFAIAQAVQQPKRRREIRIDARAPVSASYGPARLRTAPIKASVESRRTAFCMGGP
jgi:hypothetical protein